MTKVLFTLVVGALLTRAGIIDRIAVSVGKEVITAAQIEKELRVTAFLNHQPLQLTPDAKKAAAERLIQQTLLRREMQFSQFAMPQPAQSEALIQGIAAPMGEQAFADSLARYGITVAELKEHLLWQLASLEFIDYRFKPSIQISEGALRRYYEKQRTQWVRDGQKEIPSFEDARADIEKVLLSQRADLALDRWIGDARTQVNILYHPEAFQ